MTVIHEIQASLLDINSNIGPILLKLRFLAAKLGSDLLEEWVLHEIDGYPPEEILPDYRKTSVSYSGTLTNGYQQLNNISIPSHIVEQNAGCNWVDYEIRDGIDVVDDIIFRSEKGSQMGINTGNLKLLIHDKVYEGYELIDLTGRFNVGAFVRIQSAVRHRVLDLTLALEKQVPAAVKIEIGKEVEAISPVESANVTQITQQIFNGSVGNISNIGSAVSTTINVVRGDSDSLVKVLTDKGVLQADAIELAEIVALEKPESNDDPFGEKAKAWLREKVAEGASGAWKIGVDVGKELIKEALKGYYFG